MKKYIRCADDKTKYVFGLCLGFLRGTDVAYPADDPQLSNTIRKVFNNNQVSIKDIAFWDWDDMYMDPIMDLQEETEDMDEEPHYEQILEGVIDIPEDAYERGLVPSGVKVDVMCTNSVAEDVADNIISQLYDALPKIGYAAEDIYYDTV